MELQIFSWLLIIFIIWIVIRYFKKQIISIKDDFEKIKTSKKDYIDYSNYFIKKSFLTEKESLFYKSLGKNFFDNNKKLLIFPNVKLSDIINIKNNNYYLKYKGHINQRHIDFLITNLEYKILGVIELNGNEHYYSYKRNKSDNFKKELFENLGIPYFIFQNEETWNFDELNKLIF